jgi:PAS domain S-box-containing protein
VELFSPKLDDSRPWADSRAAGRSTDPVEDGEHADELAARLDLLASVFEDSPEPVVVIDGGGRVRYANPACAELIGAPSDSILLRPVAEFAVSQNDGQTATTPEGDGRCVLRGFFELRRADDELRWVSWSASPLRGSQGGVGAVVFLRDDTERRRSELGWTRRHDELEQTIRAVAHDLRSPLVAVLGFSRLLREDFAGLLGERGIHYLDRILEAGRTMESLIRELLDFARIGHAGERRVLVDPREVLEQLRGELKPHLDAQGVDLRLAENLPLLHCDRTRLYQLLSNLLGNALDHMGPCEQPRIEVTIREDAAWHRLTVRDNGRGIAPADHERVFEMFHTVPREGGRRGTGIGLAIVKKIAELHGGRAWVESAQGQGAAFHVLLPRP